MSLLFDPYIGIGDTHFLEAARWQYGSDTQLWPNDGHAYQWHAKRPLNQQRYPINLQGWSDSRYSQNYRVVMAEGVDRHAWRFFNTYSRDWLVVPVVYVAADHIWNMPECKAAASTWANNLQVVSEWYRGQLGKGFQVCRPQVVPDYRNTAQIWNLYQSSKTDDTSSPARYLPWDTAINDYKAHMRGRINTNLIYAFTHYAGPSAAWDFAAAGGGAYLFVSSFGTVERAQDNPTLFYATAHEIGHCFGLGHTEHTLASNWQQSVMQAARPPQAILCEYEKQRLLNNPFFR